MLKITDLLNPSASTGNMDYHEGPLSHSFSPPPTPALTSTTSTSAYSPRLDTPEAPSPAKRPKLIKDAAVFSKGEVKGQVHYPPFECNEETVTLPPHLGDELTQQHRRFKIFPSGSEKDGQIKSFPKSIPYSSEKKEFLGKTGLEGFNGKSSTLLSGLVSVY